MRRIRSSVGAAVFAGGLLLALWSGAQTEFPTDPGDPLHLDAATAYAGEYGGVDAYVVRSGDDDQHEGLRCPVIIVEGFDPQNGRDGAAMCQRLAASGFGLELLRAGRDIVIVSFTEGATRIQANAHALTSLLEYVNANRHDPDEPLVLIGFSMGGLVCRYSLAWCEQNGVDHDVDVFISFDSPQEGANIVLGAQEALAWLLDDAQSVLVNELSAEQRAALNDLNDSQNTPAAKQMALCHRLSGGGSGFCGPHSERTTLETELSALGDYPASPHLVAIANGSGKGTLHFSDPSHPELHGAGLILGELAYSSGSGSLTLRVFSVGTQLRTLFYSSGVTVGFFTLYDADIQRYASAAYDAAPGAWSSEIGGVAGLSVPEGRERQCFIPTFSALGLPASRIFDDLSADPDLVDESPFDEISYAVDNEEHVELNERTYEVLVRNILGGPGTALGELDLDQDGLSDREEYDRGTLGWKADSEDDGMPDGWEVTWEFDPLVDDADGDADYDLVTNVEEYVAGTNPRTAESIQWHDAVERLQAIGVAIQAYRNARRGVFPDSLTQLVDGGYLAEGVLLCGYDPMGGTDPHPYDDDAYAPAYEDGCSFFYLFSGADHPDGGSWGDQSGAAYDAGSLEDSSFPVVQCFYALPAPAEAEASLATVASLAYDLKTVFVTRGDWENEPLPAPDPELRAAGDIPCPLGGTVAFPLWSPWRELPGSFRYEVSGARGSAVVDGRFLMVSLDEDIPVSFRVSVDLLDDGSVLDTREFFVRPARLPVAVGLVVGWNLVGFPIASTDDPVQLIASSERDGELVRSPTFWDVSVLEYCDTVPAGVASPGFWVYVDSAGEATADTVQYAAPARELPAGWNLVGVARDGVLPDCAGLNACYAWNAAALRYTSVAAGDPLQAGRGYWFHLSEPCVFDPVAGSLVPVADQE